jgi:hypothetical protein
MFYLFVLPFSHVPADLGKVLLHPSFGGQPQWAVVGTNLFMICIYIPYCVHTLHSTARIRSMLYQSIALEFSDRMMDCENDGAGDTFPLGCPFDSAVVHSQVLKHHMLKGLKTFF